MAVNFIQMNKILFRLNGTEISPASQYNFPIRNNHERYYMATPQFIHSADCLQTLPIYTDSALLIKMVHLKFKDNKSIRLNNDISITNNASEYPVK